jgi:hypothetical protein
MDLAMTVGMLERAKIEYTRSTELGVSEWLGRGDYTVLTVERGYMGFVSKLFFDKDGLLVSIEAYE